MSKVLLFTSQHACTHTDIVKLLTLEMHCTLASRDANNNTALHVAVGKRHLEIVQFIISIQNFDLGQYGRILLCIAAEVGHLHMVKYLTHELGCNPSCLDEDKYSPHCAVTGGTHRHCQVPHSGETL